MKSLWKKGLTNCIANDFLFWIASMKSTLKNPLSVVIQMGFYLLEKVNDKVKYWVFIEFLAEKHFISS